MSLVSAYRAPISVLAILVPAFILVTGLPLLAQQGPDDDPDGAQGYVNNVFHHSQVDSINLYNGQLTVPIAIGPSYPIGPKLKLQLVLTYGSRVWEYGHPLVQNPSGPSTPLAGDPAVGIGWTFTLGAIKTCSSGMCYIGPDGSQRAFDADSFRPGYLKTSDASQLSLRNVGYPGSGPYEMWDGDGNHYVFGWHVSGFDDVMDRFLDPNTNGFTRDFGRGRDGWYLTSLTDPFGNGYSVGYRTGIGPCWTYSNSCAYQAMQCPATSMNLWIPQAITLPMGSPNNVITVSADADRMISGFTFPVSGAGRATWSLGYQQPPISYSETCGGSLPNGLPLQPNLRAIQSIQLPNGVGSYQFSYQNPSNCVTGYLTHMRVPTGATIDYLYGNYSFYHGRLAALNQNCGPIGPALSASVVISGAGMCIPNQPTGTLPGTLPQAPQPSCPDGPNYLDQQFGVLRRTETVSGSASVTDYVQYAFPFGEQGIPGSNCDALGRCGPQNLTVAIFPPDVDGRRRAKGVLFWSAPKVLDPTHQVHAGERTGADIEERVYDSDPTQTVVIVDKVPVCGGAQANPICADKAVRVTQRTFEYDIATSEIGNRRLLSETTYHQPPAANDVCTGCKYHTTTFSNLGGATWDGNGRHYNIETHGGNLGGDFRQVVTTWSPTVSPWFPNLLDKRVTSDATGSLNQYFDYDHTAQANGFLRGTLNWDSGRSLLFADCRYPVTFQDASDSHGNVASRYTGTFARATAPDQDPKISCSLSRSSPSSWGENAGKGDIFATNFTYQNGQKVTARAVDGSLQAIWLKYDVTRDSRTGWITSSRDAAGLQTDYLYDSLGRPTSVTPPGEAATIVSYPSAIQTIATRNGGVGLSTYEEYVYDGLGRTVRERRLMPGSRYAKRFTKFDPAGNDYFKSEWVDDATPETVSANLPTSCSFPGGAFSTSRPTSAPGTYRLCYDPFGRPQQAVGSMHSGLHTISRVDGSAFYSDTQEAGTTACVNGTYSGGSCSGGTDSTTVTKADAFGRITSVTEPGGDVTSYGYDVLGKLTSVAQGAQSGNLGRTFLYDRFGFLRSEKTPEKGTVWYDTIGSMGNVLQQTAPGNLVLSRSFDYAGRLTSVWSNEGRTYVTNAYDEASRGSSLGKLTTSLSTNYPPSGQSTATESFWYAGTGGRLSTKTTAVSTGGLPQLTESFFYNSLGLMSGHVHPRAATANTLPFVVATEYDQGLPVRQYLNGLQLVKSVSYQPSGALAGYTTGLGIGFDVTTTIESDGVLPRPKKIYATLGNGTKPFNLDSYSYDGTGNILAIGTDTFGYDSRSRLMSASYPSDGKVQGFGYDQFGNMLSRTGEHAQPLSVDPLTNRLSMTGYDYVRGNLTGPTGSPWYTWDGLDRITSQSFGSWTYLYTAESERIGKQSPVAGWTFTLRDPGKRVSTEFAGPTPSRDNVFLGNLLVASYANTSVGGNTSPWSFYSSDHLGTPRFVTHIDAPDSESHKFWPYGDEVTPQTAPQRLRFAAMEADTEGSRFYDHARHHDFGLARFLSPDVLSGRSGDPQSWNRYAYARNNPLRYVDRNGEDFSDALRGFANAFGSDFLAGAGRSNAGNSDYHTGQAFGDAASTIVGAAEAIIGGGGEVLGVALDASGAGAVVGVPVNVMSAGVIAQGATGALTGIINLARTGGESPQAKAGREAHKEFAEKVKGKEGWQSEPTIKGPNGETLRPDAITPSGRPVELKPNTPSGQRRGASQLKNYEEATGKKGRVVYYDPEP